MKNTLQQGVTLLELLVVLGIFAILTSFALPTTASVLERSRSTEQITTLYNALALARSQALSSGHFVMLCANEACINRRWEKGYWVFNDLNKNAKLDANEPVYQHFELAQGYHWYWSNFRQKSYITYTNKGFTHALNGTFTLCKNNLNKGQIIINLSGRARINYANAGAPCPD